MRNTSLMVPIQDATACSLAPGASCATVTSGVLSTDAYNAGDCQPENPV